MGQQNDEPKTTTLPATTIRHDGWTGERMATFCETLAETAVVAEACDQTGMSISGAYAARRRNPVFAAAWDAALSIARERLADTLLERAMEGTRELYYRDGEVVGERHVLDSRLGLAILRRLDRLAETGVALHSNPPLPGAKRSAPAILPRTKAIDWSIAVDALRTGDDEGVAKALALFEAPALSASKGHKVEDPPNRPPSPGDPEVEEPRTVDLTDRCWRDRVDGKSWMTDFPPPSGFDGYESRPYDDIGDEEPYERSCTPEEAAILDADEAADRAAERAEDEDLRDRWFQLLKDGAAAGLPAEA